MGGFLSTVALTLLFAVVGCASQVRLVQLGISHGVYSLHGLATLAFGSRGTLASAALQLTVSSGLIVTYFALLFRDLPVLLGHALHLALDEDGRPLSQQSKFPQVAELLRDRVTFSEILAMGVVLPFSLMWVSHPKLKHACIVVVLALFVTCCFVLTNTHALHKRNAPAFSNGQDFSTVPLTIFESIGILATTFASPRHAFHAFHALQERSLGRFACVASGATLLSLFWALGVGIGGYVSFLSGTRDDVVQNYALDASASFNWVLWILLPFCAIVGIALEVTSRSLSLSHKQPVMGRCS
ncbi:hypothetical protein BBJ28_00007245 [Nothophytophthora sp. Chile5]|nr:hypothetical protein BBJ28_00007245 [Nothophytophthora sp. Chile5]